MGLKGKILTACVYNRIIVYAYANPYANYHWNKPEMKWMGRGGRRGGRGGGKDRRIVGKLTPYGLFSLVITNHVVQSDWPAN